MDPHRPDLSSYIDEFGRERPRRADAPPQAPRPTYSPPPRRPSSFGSPSVTEPKNASSRSPSPRHCRQSNHPHSYPSYGPDEGNGYKRPHRRSPSPFEYPEGRPHPRPYSPGPSSFGPGEPNVEVMIRRIPLDMTDELIYSWLCRAEYYPEYVKIIRDRYTGESKGYGFIRFPSMECSISFMDHHFPEIIIEGTPLALEFGLHDPGDQQWICGRCQFENYSRRSSCFRCGVDRSVADPVGTGAPFQEEINDGTRDIGAESHFLLLLRHLPLQADEEVIADSVRCLGKAKRIHLVRGSRHRRSLGFAFIEYLGPIGANKALVLSGDKAVHPEGFRVCGHPVGVSFAHTRVCFLDRKGRPTLAPRRYWDPQAYISSFWVSRGPGEPEEGEVSSSFSSSSSKEPSKGASLKKGEEGRKRVKTTGKSHHSPAPMIGLSGPMDQSMASPLSILPSTTKDISESTKPGEEGTKESTEIEASSSSSSSGINPSFISRRMQSQLQFWNRQHEELKSTPQFVAATGEGGGRGSLGSKINTPGFIPSSANTEKVRKDRGGEDGGDHEGEAPERSIKASNSSSTSSPFQDAESSSPTPSSSTPRRSYVDATQLACLLCQRAFKSEETLRKHEVQSTLHRDNLQDPVKVKEAKIRLALSMPEEARLAEGHYRDRAAERRAIHGQPDQPPAPEVSFGYQQMRDSIEETNRRRAIQAARKAMIHGVVEGEEESLPGEGGGLVKAIPQGNKGSQLLRKMGWKEGQGLGREGEGIVKPLEAESYDKGVGLGAGWKRKAGDQGR
ncbi:MAG: hypothetical protein DHS80DRAFT_33270 [Piptocephalis tieghemiana]|nr:MAG: hypothetical protein DHS80DRAFT_33270 [Piptocephalis tieghemiana]